MSKWVEGLLGTKDDSLQEVRDNISFHGEYMRSMINEKIYKHGTLIKPSLTSLRKSVNDVIVDGTLYPDYVNGKWEWVAPTTKLTTVRGDVRDFINNEDNAHALFQVASQFNLLEMVSPEYTPKHGVNIYADDHTQGPICAIACGAGTIYRNYVNSYFGQTNTLSDLEGKLGDLGIKCPWEMKNGYTLFNEHMVKFDTLLQTHHTDLVEDLMDSVRYGIQQDTEVTTSPKGHTVSQIYCSALPLSYQAGYYSGIALKKFSRLIIESLYEATLCAGVLNYQRTGCNKVYLTYVGGGAFGNDINMIKKAIDRAVKIYEMYDLDIEIIEYEDKSYWN